MPNRTEYIHFRATPEEVQRIDERAKADRRSRSSWIRLIILRELDKTPEDPQ